MHLPVVCVLADRSHVGFARRHAQRLATEAGFDEMDAGRVALCVTELATNIVLHAGRGQMLLQIFMSGGNAMIELLSIDSGPGMQNAESCMRDGYSSGGTPGNGLGAVRRMSDEFDIFTREGKGCVVLARLRATSNAMAAPVAQLNWRWGALTAPAPGESVPGDSWRVVSNGDRVSLMLADGLGHGPLASEAAERAGDLFQTTAMGNVGVFFEEAHRRLRATRGAAVGVALCTSRSARLTYAGVGNIAATVLKPDGTTRGLMSHNGTVGAEMRHVQLLDYEWNVGDRLIMHSDGITSRWSLQSYPGLHDRHPALMGAVLYRDFLRGKDDATILVMERAA